MMSLLTILMTYVVVLKAYLILITQLIISYYSILLNIDNTVHPLSHGGMITGGLIRKQYSR